MEISSERLGDHSPATGPGSRGRYPKGVRRRQEIIDRSIEVFADVGFEGASLRALGEAIGVSHAALRRYFETREELFLEVLREKDRRTIFETPDGIYGALRLAEGLVEYATQVPGLMALRHSMVARALESGNEHSKRFFVDRYAAVREELAHHLSAARDEGIVRSDIPLDAMTALVVGALDGLSTQWLLDPSVDIYRGIDLLEGLLRPAVTHPLVS
ncbi:TetR/AcrR family transcriptional regulator [Leifsonia sp. 22587]|uniref:TetR/AcrR family transcriptional regulator n=1 Tax=Leifsonia sp. 22587 TaxID=3453946 RepID=UPI003F84C462